MSSDPFDTQSELHRKALDQVAHLLSGYEAGKLSAEAFRTGVETIWNVVGGICRLSEFQELMRDANREVRKLPPSTLTKVLVKDDRLIVLMHASERTRILTGVGLRVKAETFVIDDEAVEKTGILESKAISLGFKEVAA